MEHYQFCHLGACNVHEVLVKPVKDSKIEKLRINRHYLLVLWLFRSSTYSIITKSGRHVDEFAYLNIILKFSHIFFRSSRKSCKYAPICTSCSLNTLLR